MRPHTRIDDAAASYEHGFAARGERFDLIEHAGCERGRKSPIICDPRRVREQDITVRDCHHPPRVVMGDGTNEHRTANVQWRYDFHVAFLH